METVLQSVSPHTHSELGHFDEPLTASYGKPLLSSRRMWSSIVGVDQKNATSLLESSRIGGPISIRGFRISATTLLYKTMNHLIILPTLIIKF